MQIQKLTLTNYRAAQFLTLDLDPHLNVFVGVNGAGKSTVLNAVATMLSSEQSYFPEIQRYRLRQESR